MDPRNSVAQLSLPSEREILIVRDFKAPKRFVFDAWSKAEHVKRWYGCADMTLPVVEMDFRVGGQWRWVLRDPKTGTDYAMSGEYREITRPDRLVFTERYEPIAGTDHLVTLTFDERDRVTTLTERILHESQQNRDGHLQSGMERGVQEMLERLEELASSLATSS